MLRYWWPGFEMHLLEELQRQQNSTQFCDTLLQTEGISVPAHSCVLAALSPYLSEKLSTLPSPASGQKLQLQLQAVKAQTLLKLVGLLYSGEMEVKGTVEQNDVLAVAHIFGIKDLVKGDKNRRMGEELQEKMRLLGSFKDNSIHARGSDRKESRKMQDAQVQAEMGGRRDVGSPAENRVCVTTGTQTSEKPFGDCITSECSPVAQNVVVSQPQGIMIDKQFCSNSCPVIPSVSSTAQKDAVDTPDRSKNTMTFPHFLNDDTDSPKDQTHRHWKSLQAPAKKTAGADGKTTGQTLDDRANADDQHQAMEMENGNASGKRHPATNAGTKNLANMKQMLENTQTSVKMKLRRRSRGEAWEVVSQQDADETLSALGSHKKEPNIPSLPPHLNTSCGCQPPSCDLNQKDDLGTASCSQHQGNVEESDEQIEKLLDDIMMGLNILPNLEKESHDLQPSHQVGVQSPGRVPVTQNMETQSVPPVSDADQTLCDTDLSSLQPSGVAVLQQLRRTADGTRRESTPLSKVQECLQDKSRANSLIPSSAFCGGQKQHPLPPQEAPGQDNEHGATATGVEKQSHHTVFSSCMGDLQIPQCLSPLDPCTSATNHQAISHQGNLTAVPTLPIQQQVSLDGPPWLTENPGCLRFPLIAITNMKNKTAESSAMQQVEERETASDRAEPKSKPRKIKHSLKCKQDETSGDPVAAKKRKTMYTSHQQDTASPLVYEGMRVGDGTKCIKMSNCSVSLSSNNILAKERESAISSLNIPSRLKGKAHPRSPSADSLKEKTRKAPRNTGQTLTSLRRLMKKKQDSPSNTGPPVPAPVNNFSFTKRKRGRPPKPKVGLTNPNTGGQSQDSPLCHSHVLQEAAPQMANEEQPPKSQDEVKSCDAAGSSTTQCTDLVDVGGLSSTTGINDEEEEEVDILLLSPHSTPQVTAVSMEIPPEEEEEEVIDVTGD